MMIKAVLLRSISEIGERTYIGNSTIICAEQIDIENDVMISWGCTIVDHDSHSISFSKRKDDVVLWKENRKNWSLVKVSSVCFMTF